jgi:hypothetical protein
MRDLHKYMKNPLPVTMPKGETRIVQVFYDLRATWNMTSKKYPKGKACQGWVEKDDDAWTFHFKDPQLYMHYLSHCVPERTTYEDRSTIAVAERTMLASQKQNEKRKAAKKAASKKRKVAHV